MFSLAWSYMIMSHFDWASRSFAFSSVTDCSSPSKMILANNRAFNVDFDFSASVSFHSRPEIQDKEKIVRSNYDATNEERKPVRWTIPSKDIVLPVRLNHKFYRSEGSSRRVSQRINDWLVGFSLEQGARSEGRKYPRCVVTHTTNTRDCRDTVFTLTHQHALTIMPWVYAKNRNESFSIGLRMTLMRMLDITSARIRLDVRSNLLGTRWKRYIYRTPVRVWKNGMSRVSVIRFRPSEFSRLSTNTALRDLEPNSFFLRYPRFKNVDRGSRCDGMSSAPTIWKIRPQIHRYRWYGWDSMRYVCAN